MAILCHYRVRKRVEVTSSTARHVIPPPINACLGTTAAQRHDIVPQRSTCNETPLEDTEHSRGFTWLARQQHRDKPLFARAMIEAAITCAEKVSN